MDSWPGASCGSGVRTADSSGWWRSHARGAAARPHAAREDELAEPGIACSDPDEVERILEEPSNRALLALMRILCHGEDAIAWAALLKLTQESAPPSASTSTPGALRTGRDSARSFSTLPPPISPTPRAYQPAEQRWALIGLGRPSMLQRRRLPGPGHKKPRGPRRVRLGRYRPTAGCDPQRCAPLRRRRAF